MELAADLLPVADPNDVAAKTHGFTPADFALAAQRSAQLAFDRAIAGGEPEVRADDVMAAVEETRPSVSAEAAHRFDLESNNYPRL